jgi:hypothetical protein
MGALLAHFAVIASGDRSIDIIGTSPCVRRAEPSHLILSAGHGAHLRRSAGPDAPWPRSMAAAASRCLDRPSGGSVTPLV